MDFPRRGEIYLINFDPTIGHETKKVRPAIKKGARPIRKIRNNTLFSGNIREQNITEFFDGLFNVCRAYFVTIKFDVRPEIFPKIARFLLGVCLTLNENKKNRR